MKKKAKTSKSTAKKASVRSASKRVAGKPAKPAKSARATKGAKPAKAAKAAKATPKKSAAAPVTVAVPSSDGKLTFNHAMIYCKDVERGMRFYRDLMGFKLIEDFRYEGTPVYARLRAPGATERLPCTWPGRARRWPAKGCDCTSKYAISTTSAASSMQKGFYITQMPRMMPWGWRHAYLNDPDGHEISLYWAGENRMKKTVMQAARAAAKG